MLGLAWMFSLRNGSLWEECITFWLKAYLKAFRSAASVAHMAAACDIQQTTRADHVAGIRHQAGTQAGRHHASGTRPGLVTQHSIKSVLGSPSKVSHCWCKGLVSEPNSKGLKAGKKLPVKPNVCARVKTTVPETSEPSMREVGFK